MAHVFSHGKAIGAIVKIASGYHLKWLLTKEKSNAGKENQAALATPEKLTIPKHTERI